MNNIKPSVLTIAGSDSGGGAGIQADLRTFNAFGVYGCCVITAVTSQNPKEVRRVDVLETKAVRSQLECVLDLFPVRFAKCGMLSNQEIIKCTAEIASENNLSLIVDPVMVSTSGAKLLEKSAINAMKKYLFPVAKWLTPNIPEAELISGMKIKTADDQAESALELYRQYGCNVILKGGHITTDKKASDIVCFEGELYELSSPCLSITGNASHGTGCTLSSALSANLALERSWQTAVKSSKAFVYGSLAEKVYFTASLSQMYVPENSYIDKIILKPY